MEKMLSAGNENFRHLLSFLLVFITIATISTPVCSSDSANRTLLAAYYVGNNLESGNAYGEWGFFTQHLFDLREAYGKGDPDNLTVIIGYGGADKEGWKGLRIYSLQDATEDYLDNGKYDRWDSYVATYPDLDMGSPEGLSTFLKALEPYKDYNRKYLTFHGHGGAYSGGMGDENYPGEDLSLQEFNDTLTDSGLHFDLIGFDSCLMGSLEVYRAFIGIADYLVASEESEQSPGWREKPVMKALVQDPDIDPVQLGRVIVNGYIDDLDEVSGTLSLVDEQKIPAVIEALGDLSGKLSGLMKDPAYARKIQSVFVNSGQFGRCWYWDPTTDYQVVDSFTVDLITVVKGIEREIPELGVECNRVIEAASDAVILSKEKYRPYATGISIISPAEKQKYIEELFTYSPEITVHENWFQFLIGYFRSILSDREKPVITNTTGGFTISDNGYATADWYYHYHEDDYTVVIGIEPAYTGADGEYTIPGWDGKVLKITNPDTKESQVLPAYFDQMIDDKTEEYYSFVRYNTGTGSQNWGILDMIFHKYTGETSISLLPMKMKGSDTFDLTSLSMGVPLSDITGYSIIPYSKIFYKNGTTSWKPVGDTGFNLTKNTRLSYLPLDCGTYGYKVVVTDQNNNIVSGEERNITIPCEDPDDKMR